MRKLIIAIAAVTVATIAQAASINWAISNVYSTSDSTQKAAAGTYTAMLFITANSTDVTGLPTTTLAAVQDLLGKGDMASLSSLAAVTKQNTGSGLWSGATGLTGFSSGSLDAFAVVFDSTDVSSAEHYFIVNDGATKNATFTSATGMKNLAFGDQTAKSQGAWTAVPEPTSGLLLLLGMAGLALKRKHA